MNGVIVVDKPASWTSHDVVNRMRRLANTRKVGHLGTLDPMATGVLPLVTGRATRLQQFFQTADKTYEGEIRFGLATNTYDAEGEPLGEPRAVHLDSGDIEQAAERFRGAFLQTPPPVSAKKVGGRPAYKLARQNISVELKPVPVDVKRFDIRQSGPRTAEFSLDCSAGAYVRSIAHEMGEALGCGAHLSRLRRTAAGPFRITDARTLEELARLADAGSLQEALIPAANLLPEFPAERVDDATAASIRQGRDFRVSPFRDRQGARYVKAISEGGELVAIGEVIVPNLYHPVLVL